MLKDKIGRTNTILYCHRWQPTIHFYRDVLKLSVNHETDWFVEFRLTDDSYLSIADVQRATIEAAGGRGVTISLEVQDLDKVCRSLASTGIEVSEIRRVWGARAFYIHDPEGHRIEFWTKDY